MYPKYIWHVFPHVSLGKNPWVWLLFQAYKCPLTEVDRAYDEEDPKVSKNSVDVTNLEFQGGSILNGGNSWFPQW